MNSISAPVPLAVLDCLSLPPYLFKLLIPPPPLQLLTYLSPPPSSLSPIPRYDDQKCFNKAAIRNLIVQLKQHRLMKGELLMMLNLRPQDLGLLDCVVEECDLRFTEEEQEQILEIIGRVLGDADSMDVDGGGEANANGDGGGDVEGAR